MKILVRITFVSLLVFLLLGGISFADERIELIGENADSSNSNNASEYIVETSWIVADPFGEFDTSLGAAAALNRALGLIFNGHAAPEQIDLERDLAEVHENEFHRLAPFTVEVLHELQRNFSDTFPESVELKPFDLEPSEVSIAEEDGHTFVLVKYEEEEYLERLLQRLYFKLIQGPVLLTVPYSGSDESIPEDYRNWNNFIIYESLSDTVNWDETRRVYVDWDLVQTVVLKYEDGRIACYDNGRKYYIDHTAAVATAGAMLACPDLARIADGQALNYVLASTGDE